MAQGGGRGQNLVLYEKVTTQDVHVPLRAPFLILFVLPTSLTST